MIKFLVFSDNDAVSSSNAELQIYNSDFNNDCALVEIHLETHLLDQNLFKKLNESLHEKDLLNRTVSQNSEPVSSPDDLEKSPGLSDKCSQSSFIPLKAEVHEWSDAEIDNLVADLSNGILKNSDQIKFRIR